MQAYGYARYYIMLWHFVTNPLNLYPSSTNLFWNTRVDFIPRVCILYYHPENQPEAFAHEISQQLHQERLHSLVFSHCYFQMTEEFLNVYQSWVSSVCLRYMLKVKQRYTNWKKTQQIAKRTYCRQSSLSLLVGCLWQSSLFLASRRCVALSVYR